MPSSAPCFPVPGDDELPGNLQSLFRKAREKLGFVPNVFRQYAYRPERFSAWFAHYLPLHDSPMGRQVGKPGADCPVTEHVASRLLRLPLFTSLAVDEQDRVIESVLRFRCG